MKRLFVSLSMMLLVGAGYVFWLSYAPKKEIPSLPQTIGHEEDPQARQYYEWLRLRDPVTGQIPEGIRAQELAFAAQLPVRFEGECPAESGVLPMEGDPGLRLRDRISCRV